MSEDWAERYWGSNLPALLSIKSTWDPDNVFHHCQSVGSSQQEGQVYTYIYKYIYSSYNIHKTCCPFSNSATGVTTASTPSCSTVSGNQPGKPCVFPFKWEVREISTISTISTYV